MSRSTLRLGREWILDESRKLKAPGAFSDLFHGEDAEGEPVVIKRIRPFAPELADAEVAIAKRLMTEAPSHIIPILDAGRDPLSGAHFVVMRLAEQSLEERIGESGALAPAEAFVVFADVLTGLQEMGRIAHGDLKPGNILLHEGRWKLADMGIAHMMDDGPPGRPSRMFASAPYAAPEQWRFEATTRATDLYAFGCLAYAVLTGEPPFPGPQQEDYCVQHLSATPADLPASAPIRALVQMCMAKEREGRPSIETARTLLRRARRGPTGTRTVPLREPD